MGKKKASKSRKLRPLIEQYIRDDLIYVRSLERKVTPFSWDEEDDNIIPEIINKNEFEVTFGADDKWFDDSNSVSVFLTIFPTGNISYRFLDNRKHVLDAASDTWFRNELKEIIVMYRLGAYQSDLGKDMYYSGSYKSALNPHTRTLMKKNEAAKKKRKKGY